MTTTRKWIDSATLIILCKHFNPLKKFITRKSSTDYKVCKFYFSFYINQFLVLIKFYFQIQVLVFRRPENASFAPNAIVFPGGACEQTDDAEDWISFYKNQMNISDAKFKEITSVTGKREFIFQKTKDHKLERFITYLIIYYK